MVNFHFMAILIVYNGAQVGGISVKSFVRNHEGKDISSPHTVCSNSPHTDSTIRCRCSHVASSKNNKKLRVDCSGLNLTRVPDGIPQDTTILILDNNNISLLLNHSFVMKQGALDKLEILSIKNNSMTKIEGDALGKLLKLHQLNLFRNSLKYNNSLPSKVFTPIASTLFSLDLRQNMIEDSTVTEPVVYPTWALEKLVNLSELKIDCIKKIPLPDDFGKMLKLDRLIFHGGTGGLSSLPDEMFVAVADLNITYLDISYLTIKRMSSVVFSHMKCIKVLHLSGNELGIHVSHALEGLKASNSTEELYLIKTEITEHIQNVIDRTCGLPLKKLYLDKNQIRVLPMLSVCFPYLEVLSIPHNDVYERSENILDFFHLKHIIGMDLSFQQNAMEMANQKKDRIGETKQQTINNMTIHAQSNRRFVTNMTQKFGGPIICNPGESCPIWMPKIMIWINMSQGGFHQPEIPELVLLTNSSLKHVDLSYTGINSLKYRIYCRTQPGIILHIETFDFSGNSIKCANSTIFNGSITHCNGYSLKHLYFRGNNLGSLGNNECNNSETDNLGFLKPLVHLEIVDLSTNSLSKKALQPNAFSSNSHLVDLRLADNGIVDFNVNISHLKYLERLDISGNSINCLSHDTRTALSETIGQRNNTPALTVDLGNNDLKCSCNCWPFYEWMKMTQVKFTNVESYVCTFDNGKEMKLKFLNEILKELESSCINQTWIYVIWIGIGTVYFLIFLTAVIYRRRHDIRFTWYKRKLRRQRLQEVLSQIENCYEYDAFVSCDSKDDVVCLKKGLIKHLETKETGLKFSVAYREFIAGVPIMENILRQINASRKIIFFITRNFLSSVWCNEELLVAHHESLSRGRNTMICVFMPNITHGMLSDTAKMITRTVTCLQWPRERGAMELFWLMLHKAIMDGTDPHVNHLPPEN